MADMNKRIEEAGERRNKRLSLTPERVPVQRKKIVECLQFKLAQHVQTLDFLLSSSARYR